MMTARTARRGSRRRREIGPGVFYAPAWPKAKDYTRRVTAQGWESISEGFSPPGRAFDPGVQYAQVRVTARSGVTLRPAWLVRFRGRRSGGVLRDFPRRARRRVSFPLPPLRFPPERRRAFRHAGGPGRLIAYHETGRLMSCCAFVCAVSVRRRVPPAPSRARHGRRVGRPRGAGSPAPDRRVLRIQAAPAVAAEDAEAAAEHAAAPAGGGGDCGDGGDGAEKCGAENGRWPSGTASTNTCNRRGSHVFHPKPVRATHRLERRRREWHPPRYPPVPRSAHPPAARRGGDELPHVLVPPRVSGLRERRPARSAAKRLRRGGGDHHELTSPLAPLAPLRTPVARWNRGPAALPRRCPSPAALLRWLRRQVAQTARLQYLSDA